MRRLRRRPESPGKEHKKRNGVVLRDFGSLLSRVMGKRWRVCPSRRVHVSKAGTRLDGWGWLCALLNPPRLNQLRKIPQISLKRGKIHRSRGKNCPGGALQGARSQPALGSRDRQEPEEGFGLGEKTSYFFHFFLILLALFFPKRQIFEQNAADAIFLQGQINKAK